MRDSFDTVTLVGVGLLGASLGLALKRRGLANHVTGIGRRQESLDIALREKTIDEGALALTPETGAADLIVICTPAATVPDYLDQVHAFAGPETVVTDVASTKQVICDHARALWPKDSPFVGSHPMAGSEKWGPEHADAGLYENAVTFVEVGDHIAPNAHADVRRLWEAVGCRVVSVRPDEHDRLVAATSHLPHIAASALALQVPEGDAASAAIGSGFRDTTRVAEGRPELWRDIALTNRHALAESLTDYVSRLNEVIAALGAEDAEALEQFFAQGLDARRRALGE